MFSEAMEDTIYESDEKRKEFNKIVGKEWQDTIAKWFDDEWTRKAAGETIDPKKAEENIATAQEMASLENWDDILDTTKDNLATILAQNIDNPALSDAQNESLKQALAFANGSYSTQWEENTEKQKNDIEALSNSNIV